MGIPGSGGQLLILLLFVLPGSVYQTVRTRLRGPIPSDQDATTKVLRALAVSTGLNALYLAIFGRGLLSACALTSRAGEGRRFTSRWPLGAAVPVRRPGSARVRGVLGLALGGPWKYGREGDPNIRLDEAGIPPVAAHMGLRVHRHQALLCASAVG